MGFKNDLSADYADYTDSELPKKYWCGSWQEGRGLKRYRFIRFLRDALVRVPQQHLCSCDPSNLRNLRISHPAATAISSFY